MLVADVALFIDMHVYIHIRVSCSFSLNKKGDFLARLVADPGHICIIQPIVHIYDGPCFTGKHACVAFTRAANPSLG